MKTRTLIGFARILGLSAALAAGLGSLPGSLAATLQHNVVVKSDSVRLGDLFSDAGKHADRVVLQAPEPGRKIVVNVNWLYRVARAYGVEWRPLSTLDQVVVERASHLVSADRIREVLSLSIRDDLGSEKKFEIELDNRLLQIHLPGEAAPSIDVQTLQLDRRHQRFTAVLVGARDSTRPARVTATGRYYRLVDIPVLVRRMRGDEIIDRADIRLLTMRADKLDLNALRQADDLVGMSPMRTLAPGRPVKPSEIRPPVLVAKGSIVTMVYQTDRMVLTAQGKALQDGSEGETIRIQNAKTFKTIDGVVTGSGTVTVAPTGRVALN